MESLVSKINESGKNIGNKIKNKTKEETHLYSLPIKNEKYNKNKKENESVNIDNNTIIKKNNIGVFFDKRIFDHYLRVAKMLSSSDMIPFIYKGNIQNTMVAIDIAERLGVSPIMVMQNLNMIHGKPSWSSSFIIAIFNNSNRFSSIEFELEGSGDDYGCIAYASDKSTNKTIKSGKITIGMAKSEGWYNKIGSKWKTMPDQMLKYRAAAFFCRVYSPEILMGMHTIDENNDIYNSIDLKEKKDFSEKAIKLYEK